MSYQFTPSGKLTLLAATTGIANPVPNATRYKVNNGAAAGTLLYIGFGATAAAAVAAAVAPSAGTAATSRLTFAVQPGQAEVIALPLDAQQGGPNTAFFAASAACVIQPGGNA